MCSSVTGARTSLRVLGMDVLAQLSVSLVLHLLSHFDHGCSHFA